MALRRIGRSLYAGAAPARRGELGRVLQRFAAELVVGHPTFRNPATIGAELERGIAAAARVYADRRVAFVVCDGTDRLEAPDRGTLQAALAGAARALAALPAAARDRLLVAALPYDGYEGDRTPGKGSALKLIFEELAWAARVRALVLLDGDLRNELEPWFSVFRRVEEEHGDAGDFFVTARYARHFVDASLTRFVVGPLTTLMGCYVPGGISGDVVLSSGAVRREREARWDAARRRYGTDIATTFDNIADPSTVIYEVYLGAKLHDITDEAKLSVMPGEVIGAALGRILHYERLDRRISRYLQAGHPLARPRVWGPERTGVGFIDPGRTDVFDVDRKRALLLEGWPRRAEAIREVLAPESWALLSAAHARLAASGSSPEDLLEFLGLSRPLWVCLLHEAVAYLLATGRVEVITSALSYLYAAAYLEFCREKFLALGARSLGEARGLQRALGAPAQEARRFYEQEVDAPVEAMALAFHAGRERVVERLQQLARLTPGR